MFSKIKKCLVPVTMPSPLFSYSTVSPALNSSTSPNEAHEHVHKKRLNQKLLPNIA